MIVKSVLLPLVPRAAFELFTQRIGQWWPADRHHTQGPASDIFLLSNGRFYERARNGHEVELGRVRSWEPPSRILLDFFIATGLERPTEVEISFVAEEGGTRLTVTHRPKPASEALWKERAPRYAQSWEVVLAALSGAAAW
jgi:Activator of Hsp90 ATPase homolog 1-like protein